MAQYQGAPVMWIPFGTQGVVPVNGGQVVPGNCGQVFVPNNGNQVIPANNGHVMPPVTGQVVPTQQPIGVADVPVHSHCAAPPVAVPHPAPMQHYSQFVTQARSAAPMMPMQQQYHHQQQQPQSPVMQQSRAYHPPAPANPHVRPEAIPNQINPVQVHVSMAGPAAPRQMQSPSYTPSPPYAHSPPYIHSPTVPRVSCYSPQPMVQKPIYVSQPAPVPNPPLRSKVRGSSPPLVLAPVKPKTPSPVFKPPMPSTQVNQVTATSRENVESTMDQKKARESGIMPVSIIRTLRI